VWIYKITNIQNNKVYIGQTIRPITERFNRHINDALHNIIDTHFARAIRKYGKESFKIEEIDSASSQEELNQKEQYWIRYYDSVNQGYNETDAIFKSGGNTYQSKTEQEMEVIKEKIRQTKLGNLNPMARKIKRTNIITGEIDIFDTVISCAQACGIKKGKTSISTRLNGEVKSPFKNKWTFEYYNE
jgi:group I intron endonuclease